MQSHEELQQGKRSSPNTTLEIQREQVCISALSVIIWASLGAFAIYIFYVPVGLQFIDTSKLHFTQKSACETKLSQQKKNVFNFFVRVSN